MQKFDKNGRRVNPCVQINTSITNLVDNQIDVSDGNSEPQFMRDDDRAIHMFRDNDPIYYRKFDPQEYAKKKAAQESSQKNSALSAQRINPLLNN